MTHTYLHTLNTMNRKKDIQSLRKALKEKGLHYEAFLSESSDASALNEEFKGYHDMVADLVCESMDFNQVLCVSDVFNESPHKHLFQSV